MEVYRFLSNLVSEPPILTIVIEDETPQLKQALSILRYPQIEVVEFQTFRRVGVDTVHAHLFKPLYVPEVTEEPDQERYSAGDVIGFIV